MNIYTDRVINKKFNNAISANIQKFSQEYRVLAILKYLFPDEHANLKPSDNPDLQNDKNNYAIEVTITASQEQMQANREFTHLCNEKDTESQKKIKEKIENNGYNIIESDYGKIMDCSWRNILFEERIFKEAIRKKLEKVNNYREHFPTIGLAILWIDRPTTEASEKIIDWIKECEKTCGQKGYDFYYILTQDSVIYYDTKDNSESIHHLSSMDARYLSTIGRMTAENEISLSDVEWN